MKSHNAGIDWVEFGPDERESDVPQRMKLCGHDDIKNTKDGRLKTLLLPRRQLGNRQVINDIKGRCWLNDYLHSRDIKPRSEMCVPNPFHLHRRPQGHGVSREEVFGPPLQIVHFGHAAGLT